MIRIQSEEQVLEAFREIDQAEVQIPKEITFPFLLKDYLSWVEPSGHRTYLLFNDEDSKKLLGVVFKRTQEANDAPVKMCQWCHSVRGGGRVGLLSMAIDRNRRVGMHLCRDLTCKEKIHDLPGVNDLKVDADRNERSQALLDRMIRFLRGQVF